MSESQTETNMAETTSEEIASEQKAILSFLTVIAASSTIRKQFPVTLEGDDLRVSLVPSGADVIVKFEVRLDVQDKAWGCVRSMKIDCKKGKLSSLKEPTILRRSHPRAAICALSNPDLLNTINKRMLELGIAGRPVVPAPITARQSGTRLRVEYALAMSEDGVLVPCGSGMGIVRGDPTMFMKT